MLTLGLTLTISSGICSVIIYKMIEKEPIVSYETVHNEGNNQFTSNKTTLTNDMVNLEMAATQSIHAVVHVKTASVVSHPNDQLYRYLYGKSPQPKIAQGTGSGVIISEDGYIVTNNHVIDEAEKIAVTLNNKKTYEAEVIGTDPNTDLALLKIDVDKLPFISYGNSNDVNVGQWVIAVGNPFNLTSTVTAGIVSAKGRDINILRNDPYSGMSAIESFIQTDAAVNPGNSGGALVASTGELIGINSAIKSNTGSYTGYSFAIPVNIVKKVVKDLKEFGSVQRAFIGVSIRNLDEHLANEAGIENLSGIYVNETTPKGSAGKSGIKKGDIIKMIGTKTINDVAELQEEISQFRPGDKAKITVLRNNKKIMLPVVLKNKNGTEKLISNSSNETEIMKALGATFKPIDKNKALALNLKGGVQVDQLFNGKMRKVGIQEGFIITRINHKPIKSIEELVATVDSATNGVLIEGMYENGHREFYGFGI